MFLLTMPLWKGWLLLIWSLDYLAWTDALENDKEGESAGVPVQPVLPEGAISYDEDLKRAHNMIRFGKRSFPNDDSETFDPEKRVSQRSYLYLGNQPDTTNSLSDLLQSLRVYREKDSWKRGHNIMRFGKRKDNHSFIHFGKRMYGPNNVYDLLQSHPSGSDVWSGPDDIPEDEKRAHSMLYFGKRGGHSMMYFGKRGEHSMMYFGKRGGHAVMHFGKRSPDDVENGFEENNGNSGSFLGNGESSPDLENEKRSPHSIIRFGKRFDDDSKRAHSMIHFGKRFGDTKKAHSMIHFGKRDQILDAEEPTYSDSESGDASKRAHSMIHFGKRENAPYDSESSAEEELIDEVENKRAPHSMIHFGKRDVGEVSNPTLTSMDSLPYKRYHSVLHFGKRLDDQAEEPVVYSDGNAAEEKRNHAMIHFGKRYEGARGGSHAMIHFGKRDPGDGDYTPKHVNKRSSIEEWSYKDFFLPSSANGAENTPTKNSTQASSKHGPSSGEHKDAILSNKDSNQATRPKREAISLNEPMENVFPLRGYELMVKMQPRPSFSEQYIGAGDLSDKASDNYDREELYNMGTNHDFQFLPSRQIRSDFLSELTKYRRPFKKENAKNVFLHFGKR